ncbi:pectate lyase [Sphingomonas sp. DT-204]|uniref:pectate lyase n=1 Tax=Sphingomonas sp. DT-204 TaxID=3396166 RepID=UPI003F1B1C51
MRRVTRLILGLGIAWVAAAAPALAGPAALPRERVLDTMKRATRFMVEKVAVHGGYVWSYLPDFSRRWGEMEAYPTMVWVQPPGTATMGHLFLDAYHATGDDYYYQAAAKAADALIEGQLASGGWHYFIDYGGPESTRRWYATIGRNAWRLEEFQHDWGNATFDDAGTSEAMQFLLRLYLEKRDPRFKPALDKALNFVLASQYPNGGWPQRYPATKSPYIDHGKPDYTGFITFNDDVAAENIKFLLMYQQTLGDPRIPGAIRRAMDVFVAAQQPAPQAGWGLQYTLDMRPTGARTYEPTALVTHTTAANIRQLFQFYRLTGDPKFLARVPEALAWLDSVRLPDRLIKDGKAYPTFVEIGTNRPLFVHRRGSDVVNGEYYVDGNPEHTLEHYSSFRTIDVAKLRAEYARLKAIPGDVIAKDSPLRPSASAPLPRYFLVDLGETSDRNLAGKHPSAAALVASLNAQGWWPTELKTTSHPYTHDGSPTPAPGDYGMTRVGDDTDTSPYIDPHPAVGISTGAYIENMETLIAELHHAQ